MSDTEERKKLKRITIKTEAGSKWFDDPDKLLAWVQVQRQLYRFHVNVSNRYSANNWFVASDNCWNALQQQITNGLGRFKNDPTNYNNHVTNWINTFQNNLSSKQIFTEDAPFASFIQRQAKLRPEYGVAAIAVIFNINLTGLDRFVLDGIKQAEDYVSGSSDQVNDQSESMQQLRDLWDEELTEKRDGWVSEYQGKIDEATIQNQKVDGLIGSWQEQTETQTTDLESHKQQFKEKFSSELTKAKEDLENLTKTYDDKLALQASVRYWKSQEKYHKSASIWFAIATGVAVAIVLYSLITFANNHLAVGFKDIQVSRLLISALLASFGVWIVKICANLFMSHNHLRTDAQERRTMIHTYLALLRKGQGPREEDRQLILQTLFRPSNTGMIKEDAGPSNLVDMVNRLSPKSNS